MSARPHTSSRHLELVAAGRAQGGTRGERIVLPPSPRLAAFLERSAELGLEAADAVRLALERALALKDAQLFGVDVEAARRILRREARDARPAHPLSEPEAAYVRRLSLARPVRVSDPSAALVVPLSQRTLTRARRGVPESALHSGIVEEMIAWEIAARFEGRPLGEWAVMVLAMRFVHR